jgi:peptidoglycan hydrolase-like protein with peptidoglycan-binding domain
MEPTEPRVISADHPRQEARLYQVSPTTGTTRVNRLYAPTPKPVACFALPDPYFHFDSSAITPDIARTLGELRDRKNAHPDALSTIFGHADPVGSDEYNKKLSGRRARAFYALLTRNVDIWLDLYNPVDGDSWGLLSTQSMLATVTRLDGSGPYYTGVVDGISGNLSTAAIRALQKDQGLNQSGSADKDTRRILYRLYMDAICVSPVDQFVMGPDEFLGDPARNESGDGKSAYQGCSEHNPVLLFSKDDEKRYAQSGDKTERNARNACNRRLLVFLFSRASFVNYDGAKMADTWPCPSYKDGPAGCHARFWPDGDQRRQPGPYERKYVTDRRTMACSWYDRFARLSPCEGLAGKGTLVRVVDKHIGEPVVGYQVTIRRAGLPDETRVTDSNGMVLVDAAPGEPFDFTIEDLHELEPPVGTTP